MPRNYDMTWVPDRQLWRKMYKGKVYTVSCKQLRELGYDVTADTQVGSYPQANLWWFRKKAEIDAAETPARPPMTPLEQTARAYFKPPEVWEEILRDLDARGVPRQAALNVPLWSLMQDNLLGGKPLPPNLVENLPPARVQQIEDAGKLIRGEPAAAPDQTVEAHADLWLKRQQTLVEAGQMTSARCSNNRTCLDHFKSYLGPQSDAAGTDATKLEGFYLHVMGKIRRNGGDGWSVAYVKDVFSVARSFVRWLWERGVIELPRNIDTKFKFGSPAKAVETWTHEDFRRAVKEAPGKLKLAILLMANCGMTQQDVSDLRDTEVDWDEGRVIRKRSKTAAHENVPTVNYRLWPLTFQLLKQYRSGTERVLLTESGRPYVRTDLKNGKLVKADGFASSWVHVKKRLKLDRPLKQLRKLGASLLASHANYGRFQSYFLGHSPRTVADRHYVVPPQDLFDEAVLWLGKKLSQV
jgi:integrase